MLSHLVYLSKRMPKCTAEEIEKILVSCTKNNALVNITGVLLYSETQFIQYLEGDYTAIMALYDKIKMDDRHGNAILISSAPIKERLFPSWQMGSKNLGKHGISFHAEVSQEDKKLFEEILNGVQVAGNRSMALLRKLFKVQQAEKQS